jgi:hypothetical protein
MSAFSTNLAAIEAASLIFYVFVVCWFWTESGVLHELHFFYCCLAKKPSKPCPPTPSVDDGFRIAHITDLLCLPTKQFLYRGKSRPPLPRSSFLSIPLVL